MAVVVVMRVDLHVMRMAVVMIVMMVVAMVHAVAVGG